jgi:hypothetical protein
MALLLACDAFHPILILTWFSLNVVTLNLSILSKRFVRVHHQSLGNHEFLECHTCKCLACENIADCTTVHNMASSIFALCVRHDFQFFNNQRLNELYEKEVRYLMVIFLARFLFVTC